MLGFGLTVAGLGMGVVFAELVILVGVIWVITNAAKIIEGKKNPVTVKPAQPPVAEIPAQSTAAVQEDEDVAVVIAAAVAAFSKGTMVIKAITRMPGVQAPAWSMAGRQETMSLRQL